MTNIRRNMGCQIAYHILMVITPLVTSPALSRALGAQTLGVFSATQAYINYFLLFAMLGVEDYGNRTIAAVQDDEQKKQKNFWNIYAIQLTATLISSSIYFATIPFLSQQRRSIHLLQGLWLLSYGLDINWFFFGIEEFELTVKRSVIIRLATVAAILAFVHSPDDLRKYVVIMAGGNVVSQSFLWLYIRRFVRFERPRWRWMKPHLKPVFILFVPIMAGSVYHIMDKTMLDIFSSEASLGYYYSADKVVNIPLGVITAVGTVMLPRIANMAEKARENDVIRANEKAIELTTFLTASIGFGIATITREFVPFFFGEGYEPCVNLLYWFIPVLFAKAWNHAIRAQYLIPLKKDKVYIYATVAGATVNLILNIVLIRRYAATGAVIATLIAEWIVLGVEQWAVRKDVSYGKLFWKNKVYILFGTVMFAICRVIRRWLPFGNAKCTVCLIAAGALIYMIQAMVYWSVSKESMFHPYMHIIRDNTE